MTENIKLVCFDVDDTLIEQNSWERLNATLGITEAEDQAMYHQYKDGEITYHQWLEKLEGLYAQRGLVSKTLIEQTLTSFVFRPQAEATVHYLQEKGYELAIVSGSFNILAESIAIQLGIKHFFGSTKILIDGTNKTAKLVHLGNEDQAKLNYLKGLCTKLEIDIKECVCIADGANDRPMFEVTGKGITFKDSPVADVAWKTVTTLEEIKNIL